MKKILLALALVAMVGLTATSCTESQQREIKSITSNWTGGLNRTVTVYDYNGQKIKITNIAAIVYDNPCTSMVYGNYEINEHGVVSPAFETEINEGITRIA